MNKQEFSELLDGIRHATDLSSNRWYNIEGCIREMIGCSGCGEGSNCKKDIENRPCYDEYDECDACKSGNPLECTRTDPCEDCLWCGCPKCEFPLRKYEGCVYSPGNLYIERIEELEKQVVAAVEESVIPVETWMSLFSKHFIKKYYPYEINCALWERYEIEPPLSRALELEQLAKTYDEIWNSVWTRKNQTN